MHGHAPATGPATGQRGTPRCLGAQRLLACGLSWVLVGTFFLVVGFSLRVVDVVASAVFLSSLFLLFAPSCLVGGRVLFRPFVGRPGGLPPRSPFFRFAPRFFVCSLAFNVLCWPGCTLEQ